jgi:adenine-specific DNA methylase
MFNSRQLLVHAQLNRAIMDADENQWPLDVREQALGAFQQYLKSQNMFMFWDQAYDKIVPMFSNANYHPKRLTNENCVFHKIGRVNWESSAQQVIDANIWSQSPWELVIAKNCVDRQVKSEKVRPDDLIQKGSTLFCGSSTDLSPLSDSSFDLVITDPPFSDNIFYADLAGFFYVWIRLPLLKWYQGRPEREYFTSERSSGRAGGRGGQPS